MNLNVTVTPYIKTISGNSLEVMPIDAVIKNIVMNPDYTKFTNHSGLHGGKLNTEVTRQADVLLDEPTAHLDVENRIEVLRTLRDVAQKTRMAILFSSHDLHDALQVADRVFALTRDGRFLASGPFDKLRDPDVVLRAAFPALADLL